MSSHSQEDCFEWASTGCSSEFDFSVVMLLATSYVVAPFDGQI